MSIQDFIAAMPKVELNVRLEGAMRKDTLLLFAEQNDVQEELKKRFAKWVDLLEQPDYEHLDELIEQYSSWLVHADDLTRTVYELGVDLAKQNVKYAEVMLNPTYHQLPGMTLDQMLAAVNDGRDRVERGWGIKLRWVIGVLRSEPRKADDTLRWASSAAARRGGIVGFALVGHESAQPAGQFERAFATAHKRELPTAVQAGDVYGGEGIQQVLDELNPARFVDAWGLAESPELLRHFADTEIPVALSMARAVRQGWVEDYSTYPLQKLYDEGVKTIIGADFPVLYDTSLTQEYQNAIAFSDLTPEDIEDVVLNAVRFSFQDDEEKQALVESLQEQFSQLRAEFITSEAE